MKDRSEVSREAIDLSNLTLDELNMRVTELIITAERLGNTSGDPSEVSSAWAEVSLVEEVIAEKAENDIEKLMAQRGAIMAAQSSGDQERVVVLFERYGPKIWITEG